MAPTVDGALKGDQRARGGRGVSTATFQVCGLRLAPLRERAELAELTNSILMLSFPKMVLGSSIVLVPVQS